MAIHAFKRGDRVELARYYSFWDEPLPQGTQCAASLHHGPLSHSGGLKPSRLSRRLVQAVTRGIGSPPTASKAGFRRGALSQGIYFPSHAGAGPHNGCNCSCCYHHHVRRRHRPLMPTHLIGLRHPPYGPFALCRSSLEPLLFGQDRRLRQVIHFV
jgi:hypothetical protein